MIKLIVVCLVILYVLFILSNPVVYFRKEEPTTRLPIEGVRIVQRFSSPYNADVVVH
jgi:hypothetical protein